MEELQKDGWNVVQQRLANPFLFTLLWMFCIWNYDTFLYLFYEPLKMSEKLEKVKGTWHFANPFFYASMYTIFFPLIDIAVNQIKLFWSSRDDILTKKFGFKKYYSEQDYNQLRNQLHAMTSEYREALDTYLADKGSAELSPLIAQDSAEQIDKDVIESGGKQSSLSQDKPETLIESPHLDEPDIPDDLNYTDIPAATRKQLEFTKSFAEKELSKLTKKEFDLLNRAARSRNGTIENRNAFLNGKNQPQIFIDGAVYKDVPPNLAPDVLENLQYRKLIKRINNYYFQLTPLAFNLLDRLKE